MDWDSMIERNREALLRIVATLFAMTGLAEGERAATLPRHVRSAIQFVLQPAESTLRRLIAIAARGLSVKLPRLRARKSKPEPKPKPKPKGIMILDTDGHGGIISRYAEIKIAQVPIDAPATASVTQAAATDGEAANPETKQDAPVPAFRLIDPPRRRGSQPESFEPRASAYGTPKPKPYRFRLAPNRDDPVDARRLMARLLALRNALGDIPREAKRLALWRARRERAIALLSPKQRPLRPSPMRIGLPPGFRLRPVHEIDQILRDCDRIAHDAWFSPDTS